MSEKYNHHGAADMADLAADIRSDMRGELEAITMYTEHARRAPTAEAAAVFEHIAGDERHHLMELLALLLQVDPAQCRAYMDVFGRGARQMT